MIKSQQNTLAVLSGMGELVTEKISKIIELEEELAQVKKELEQERNMKEYLVALTSSKNKPYPLRDI